MRATGRVGALFLLPLTLTTPQSIPSELTAGDRWQWTYPSDAYPADAWDLTYYLRGPGSLDIAAVPDGGDPTLHTLTAAAALTAGLPAGRYHWTVRVVGSTPADVRTIERGVVDVRPDPATAQAGEMQSHAARMVPLLEEALERRVKLDQSQYQILARAATREELRDYERLLARYRGELAAELHGPRVGWRNIHHAFARPSG